MLGEEHESCKHCNKNAIMTPHRSANVRDLGKTKTVPENRVIYRLSKKELGTPFLTSSPADGRERNLSSIRTVIFLNTIGHIENTHSAAVGLCE